MRATIMPRAHDVRIDNVPDASIQEPTDAIIRVTRACICGSDLWPYNGGPNVEGQRMGHEAIGVVEDVGSDVRTIERGDVVIMPFANSDGSCMSARRDCRLPAYMSASSETERWTAHRRRPCAFRIVAGGPAPTRAYIDELLPDVMDGRIDPGRVFDQTVGLDGVPVIAGH
jgi:hypothetical protein